MITYVSLSLLILLLGESSSLTEACSSTFTNLDVTVNVDHSTNVGEVVYTLENGNDARCIEMQTSGTYGFNPDNDHEVIVTACPFWMGSETLQVKMSGDTTSCGYINFQLTPAIPRFTNPTDITKIGAIVYMDYVDVVQITFANDQCASFDCPTVSCTNDGSQNFDYDSRTRLIGIFNTNLQYGVTYTIEVTCQRTTPPAGTNTQTLSVIFFEMAPTTTTTLPATTTRHTTTTITPTYTTTTSMKTSRTPSTTTTTPATTTATPATTTTTPATTTTTPATTTTTLTITTSTPTTTTTTPSTTTTSPATTTTTPTTTKTTPTTTTTTLMIIKTKHSSTTTTASTTATTQKTTMTTRATASLTTVTTKQTASTTITTTNMPATSGHTTISATPSMQYQSSTNDLTSEIDVSDPVVTNIVAMVASVAVGGVGLFGLLVFTVYMKFGTTNEILPGDAHRPFSV